MDGKAVVNVWAPFATRAYLKMKSAVIALEKKTHGVWTLVTRDLMPGDDYSFILDDKELPDPASLCQPHGVHGPSQALDLLEYKWTDLEWTNPPLEEYIIYEIHVGTFSEDGTFNAIIDKLSYLKELGITAIELMPVAHFPGERNWGYDGVFPFATHRHYGGARSLQELVDRCHACGIAVILDVVYNHLGPEGNYFKEFGPYFTSKYKTPWGDAINFDDSGSDPIRQFYIENVLMWLRDFHIDALRLDAVHAIKDLSPVHILREMREYTDALIRSTWRMHYLIAEVDLNDTKFVDATVHNGYGMDAQWTDEFHHALRVTTGQERRGYYSDFNGMAHLAKAYRDAYVYDGQYSEHRAKHFGVPAHHLPGSKFIVFSQNHDQVGNRMLGERSSELVSFNMLKVMAGATLLSPYIPLLFMGEEYGETNPFLYFVDHSDPKLIERVRNGRKEEFAAFQTEQSAPDPQSAETFQRSKLQWDKRHTGMNNILFSFYKEIIALRKTNNVLRRPDRKRMDIIENIDGHVLVVHRWYKHIHLWMIINFSDMAQPVALPVNDVLYRMLDSGDEKWKGNGSSPLELPDGRFEIPSESLVVYTSTHA